jgi:hypothetical protein
MHRLNETQIALIDTCVAMSGVEQKGLQLDLVDHVCSMVEERLDAGESFENALNQALKRFGSEGLRNIQKETYSVLTPNRMIMKNITVIMGSVVAVFLFVGVIFKVMHWPLASVLIVLGMSLLVMPFLPLLLIHNLRGAKTSAVRAFHVVGYLGMSVLVAGSLFKIQHWPYATAMLSFGGGVLLFGYLPMYFFRKYQESSNRPVTLATFLVSFTALLVVYLLLPM